MASKYLNSLSDVAYKDLTDKLFSIQNGICFICQNPIDLELHSTNVDHIVPLANKGKDSEENFALTHESCNKSKQDANLEIARMLHFLQNLQDEINEHDTRSASLKDLLFKLNGSKYDFKHKINEEYL